jgi:putative PIN family toxin of toxin-antitoxin system
MKRRVLVVDTNIIVAGLISIEKNSPVAVVLDAMLDGRLLYLLSPALLAEYRAVLLRPKLLPLHNLSVDEIDSILTTLVANAIWREPRSRIAAPDPGDDHLWALLTSQPRSALVTGDRLLLENPPEHHRVISAKACATGYVSPG